MKKTLNKSFYLTLPNGSQVLGVKKFETPQAMDEFSAADEVDTMMEGFLTALADARDKASRYIYTNNMEEVTLVLINDRSGFHISVSGTTGMTEEEELYQKALEEQQAAVEARKAKIQEDRDRDTLRRLHNLYPDEITSVLKGDK